MSREKKADPRAWKTIQPALPSWVLDYAEASGFAKMTAVQASVLPQWISKRGTDVVVEAVTGSGKTLAFLLPICVRLLGLGEPTKRHNIASIIISPTRELASQIHQVLLSLLAFHPESAEMLPFLDPENEEKRPVTTTPVIVSQLLVGGSVTPAADLAFFMRTSPNILISTPGRLVELLQSRHVHCPQSSFEMLVLDEADRLLDLGFKQDIQRVLGILPKQRRTGLFSASVSEAVSEIIRVGLRNPVKISVRVKSLRDGGIIEDRKVPASLEMRYIATPASHKLPALAKLLEKMEKTPQKTIVFVGTCAQVDYFQYILPLMLPKCYTTIPLHGKHATNVRERNFTRFVTSTSPSVLFTTDLAARGLDIPQVDLVVQIDPPSDPKVFIHRNGRSGRAGRKGLALVMLHSGHEETYTEFLEIRQTPIFPLTTPDVSIAPDEAARTTEIIRTLARSDRAVYDKAQKAFVSWVRSYTKHAASSIFRAQDLDWADLAEAWGLLRMPRMPELKTWDGDRMLGQSIDWDTFAYKDKAREKLRLEALAEEKADGGAKAAAAKAERLLKRKNNEAWSLKNGREDVRSDRRDKRQKKTEAKRMATMTEAEKVEKADLDMMLSKIREQNATIKTMSKEENAEEFGGFDD
ncbi:ATP-dependent rRNA helicase spb4 [Ceratocystis pirilliformis]|uniref:ATP-dependent RNA helicase n=1 Tax=Ceratocystis pirilliformis TaxID=259994 RepID=A0ABR3ZGV2_9PEZI